MLSRENYLSKIRCFYDFNLIKILVDIYDIPGKGILKH